MITLVHFLHTLESSERERMDAVVEYIFKAPEGTDKSQRLPKDIVIREVFEACGLDPRTNSKRKNEKILLAVLKAKGRLQIRSTY